MATVAPPWAYTLQLPHDPRAPGIARCTLRAVLRSHGMAQLADTAELLASELVTNAHLHSSGPYALRLSAADAERLRVGVWDTNPDIPAPFGDAPHTLPARSARSAPSTPPAPHTPGGCSLAESGRGLELVRLCADSWGSYLLGSGPAGRGGKLLWVECERDPDARSKTAVNPCRMGEG